ncbi:MAG: aspartate kinase [Bacteroidales bacterium]|nr:aspartate kinase [Bacteroidales bacterium]
MKVFKFGGASVKDAAGVRNVARILENFNFSQLVVVISAIGKTTNLLEEITRCYWNEPKSMELTALVSKLKDNHYSIVNELVENPEEINCKLQPVFTELENVLSSEKTDNFDFEYDRIVSFGEILSTTLVSTYLNTLGHKNIWLDARKMIITDSNYREGKVDWEKSVANVKKEITGTFKNEPASFVITQGFIAGTDNGNSVTLGREGSDYSAAILAYSLDAESVTIWKDVPGVLNADPKFFPDAVKLDEISYEEAIELSYYGATIIHPKTLKPLQNKNIPLYVKSFFDINASGTVISASIPKNLIPSYIFKRNQILITLFPKDFSFIGVDNLSEIFNIIFSNKLKINVMQSTALSFSVCVDNVEGHVQPVIDSLMKNYKVKYNNEIELITIRHYSSEVIDKVVQGRKIYLEQKSRTTLQLVVKGFFTKQSE